jgi:5-methylthioadenosine/S-adenosylhomocysteine deaminase
MARPRAPIDPLTGPSLALGGRIATLDDHFTVIDDGVIYISQGRIAAVQPAQAMPPAGFEKVAVHATKGTIYPGLIELHNHLSYNALPLWDVPKRFENRDQWAQGDTYRKLVTGPMKVLAHTPRYLSAVVRYVECKCLLGGTTTSQGIALASYSGMARFYRGIVRNVEQTDDPALPEALTHIADVEATDRDKFLARLRKSTCVLLHLSEGTNKAAREHFLALRSPAGVWAITPSLAGIHCVALTAADFRDLAAGSGAMIWSPLSNLLLYGATADIKSAKKAGVRIGLGPDWAPSGSKNLLGELKVARLVSRLTGSVFTDPELVRLATRGGAEILQWDKELGSLEAGKRADLLVIAGQRGEAHSHLLEAPERDIELVIINGVPRYGTTAAMRALLGATVPDAEAATIAGRQRLLYLHQDTADPDVAPLTLAEATSELKEGLSHLPELAHDLLTRPALSLLDTAPGTAQVFLALDHDELPGLDVRPHLPDARGRPTAEPSAEMLAMAATPLQDLLVPLQLDPLTVTDDPNLKGLLAKESNLPADVHTGLAAIIW